MQKRFDGSLIEEAQRLSSTLLMKLYMYIATQTYSYGVLLELINHP